VKLRAEDWAHYAVAFLTTSIGVLVIAVAHADDAPGLGAIAFLLIGWAGFYAARTARRAAAADGPMERPQQLR
jgi:hypothetical protein